MPMQVNDKVLQLLMYVQQLNDIPRKRYPVYRLGIYSKDVSAVKSVLCQPNFLPHYVNIQAYGMAKDLLPALKEAAKYHGRELKVVKSRHIIVADYKPGLLETISGKLAKEFFCTDVRPESVKTIADAAWNDWVDYFDSKEHFERTLEFYRSLGGNVGIYDKSTDNLAAWALTNTDKSAALAQTMGQYQGRNLQFWVLQEMARRATAQDENCYSYFDSKRTLSENAQKQLGSKIHYNLDIVNCLLLMRDLSSKL